MADIKAINADLEIGATNIKAINADLEIGATNIKAINADLLMGATKRDPQIWQEASLTAAVNDASAASLPSRRNLMDTSGQVFQDVPNRDGPSEDRRDSFGQYWHLDCN